MKMKRKDQQKFESKVKKNIEQIFLLRKEKGYKETPESALSVQQRCWSACGNYMPDYLK